MDEHKENKRKCLKIKKLNLLVESTKQFIKPITSKEELTREF
jgi:hypothetical protein